MKQWLDKLNRWLHLDRIEDAQERMGVVTLYVSLFIGLLAAVPILVIQMLTGNVNSSNLTEEIVLGVVIFMLLLTWLGQDRWARWLFPALIYVAITRQLFLTNGIYDVSMFVYPVLIVISGLLLRRRGITVFTLLILAAVAVLSYQQIFGPAAYIFTDRADLGRAVITFAMLAATGGIVWILVNNLFASLSRLQIQDRGLAQANRELQLTQASLEAQVAERTRSIELARLESESARQVVEDQAWQATELAQINNSLRGEQDVNILAQNVIRQLCLSLEAPMGALYLRKEDIFYLAGSYAYQQRKGLSNQFRLGEGLVGQVALEKQIIQIARVPAGYMLISGLLETAPQHIMAAPFMVDGNVTGVIELATLSEFSPGQQEFLHKALEGIGIAFNTAQARTRIDILLSQTQQQAQELQFREDELRTANDELQQQTQALRTSQQRLQAQQLALESANAELEEKTAVLQEQRAALDRQNQDLKVVQQELEKRADQLALASKYKSEFLANMSHELRTPLNSLLILAHMLSNNDDGNLTPDQVESATIIYNSGSDLLSLINEILDLAKVESGKMQFNFAPMYFVALPSSMHAQFDHLAEQKGLTFDVVLTKDLPDAIQTDQQRAYQVIKNLLSNAFKFTEKGSVRLLVERSGPAEVAFRVVDTGIGMTEEQQRIVFEAFQQADGSTNRKYGGTGLGLTISREMALHLGGRIELSSVLGKGSTFTLYLPMAPVSVDSEIVTSTELDQSAKQAQPADQAQSIAPAQAVEQLPVQPELEQVILSEMAHSSERQHHFDDRQSLRKGDRILLVIEDDPGFARVMYDYAHKKDFKCLLADNGETGLELVRAYHPDAIALDLKLPGMSGWQVLDILKQDSDTRHIPVHILSASEESLDAFKMGAIGFLTKPVSSEGMEAVFAKIEDFIARQIKSLLIVEDDAGLRHSVRQLLGGSDVKISEAGQAGLALQMLHAHHFDCMILDLNLPDMNGFELLNRINADETISKCPVIVYTGKALTEEENAELLKYANSVIIKGVKSPERLLDETALFLHRVVAEMPEDKQRAIKSLHGRDAVFAGKHILVVDDDMRNAFALSKLLGEKEIKVSIARSGQKALDALESDVEIDLVLMDIMMPEMDGYEAMRRIRAQQRFQDLPILALTAKAMKGDQEKCIAAGANDYLPKPIDAERLFSVLRVWLYR